MRGYGGRILFIDVATGPSREQPLTESVARAYLGGNGLAARLALDHVPAGVDAWDLANAAVFGVGPVTDTTATSCHASLTRSRQAASSRPRR